MYSFTVRWALRPFPIALSLLRDSVCHCSFLSGASMCRIHTCVFEHQRSLCIRRAVMASKCCVIFGIRLILALYCMLGTGRMISHCYTSLLFVQHSALLQGYGWSRGLFRFLRLQDLFTQLSSVCVSLHFFISHWSGSTFLFIILYVVCRWSPKASKEKCGSMQEESISLYAT